MEAKFFWTSINFNGAVYLGYKPHPPTMPINICVNGAQFGIVMQSINNPNIMGYMDYNFGGLVVLALERR